MAGALGVVLAGCGNARTPVPSASLPAAPGGLKTLHYPRLGITLRAPANWAIAPGRAPLVATIGSGQATCAVWRYPRQAPAPAGLVALRRARQQLVARALQRDPGLTLIDAGVTRIDGRPAVVLDAYEQISGQPRRVRSTHVFGSHAEIVLDEYAPVGQFSAVEQSVFSPLTHSLVLA